MKLSKILTIVVWLGLLMGSGGLMVPPHAGAFSGVTINPDRLQSFEVKASVMAVNLTQSYLIVAEKQFAVTEYKIGEEIFKTELLDANGNPVPLNFFKKGQRVTVKSIKLPNGDFIANSVQLRTSRSRRR